MLKLKKYAMMTVKAGIGAIPKPIREQLKKSPAMETLYSQALHKSGLFYGYPSRKKINALYRHVIKRQNEQLRALTERAVQADVIIYPGSSRQVRDTLDSLSLQRQQLGRVFVFGDIPEQTADNITVCEVSDWSALCEQLGTHPLLMLEAGDRLHPYALLALCESAADADICYCDTDEFKKDKRESPRLLPDWNPDLQLSSCYIATGVMLSKPTVQFAIAQRTASSFSSVAEFVSALWLGNPEALINHVPLSLIAHTPDKKRVQTSLTSTATWLENIGVTTVMDSQNNVSKHQWPVFNQPLVSLIIPTKNAHELVRDCITSIVEKTLYENYEILLVDNNSDDPVSLAYFNELAQHPKVRLLKYPQPFNYSAINNFAAGQAKGDIIGLINNDVEVINGQWLSYMVGHALRDDIGCVGAKLFYSDGRIQHAGVVMGYGGGAGHAHKYFPRDHPGYLNRLVASHNYCAVTAACLLVKRSQFEAVGGLNEKDLTVAFNDVDFCLKVRELGVRNLYCAEAELFHHESVSRGLDSTKEKRARFMAELDYLQTRWHDVIAHDPAYNKYLTLKRENFAIKEPREH